MLPFKTSGYLLRVNLKKGARFTHGVLSTSLRKEAYGQT